MVTIFNLMHTFILKTSLFLLVGRPIHVSKVINPTPEEVEEVHVKFTAALIELFEANKERLLVNPKIKLHID